MEQKIDITGWVMPAPTAPQGAVESETFSPGLSRFASLNGVGELGTRPAAMMALISTTRCMKTRAITPLISRNVLGAAFIVTLCGILVAGLWPFHSPNNQVHWLGSENGLRFDRYGTVLSSGQFESASSDGPSCSLAIWIKQAHTWDTGTLLTFYDPLNHRQFSLQQNYTDLALQRDIGDEKHQTNLNVDDIFRRKQSLITVTSDGQDTAVYVNGSLVT